jgi:hypothetical protein
MHSHICAYHIVACAFFGVPTPIVSPRERVEPRNQMILPTDAKRSLSLSFMIALEFRIDGAFIFRTCLARCIPSYGMALTIAASPFLSFRICLLQLLVNDNCWMTADAIDLLGLDSAHFQIHGLHVLCSVVFLKRDEPCKINERMD